MKTLALTTSVFVASAAGLLAQGQSDIEALRSRAESHERRISILEKELSRLRGAQPKQPTRRPASTSATKRTALASEYVVVKGDMLTRIAYRHKTSVDAIKKENNLRNDNLRIGQKLRIPGSQAVAGKAIVVKETPVVSKKTTPAAPAPVANKMAKGTHTVQSGETFYSIARKHKVSVNSMVAANPKVKPSQLQVGQKLTINGSAKRVASSVARPLSKAVAQAPKKKPATAKKAPVTRKREVAKAPAERVADPSTKPKEVVRNASADRSSPVQEEPEVRTITVHQQMTYGQFASRYGSSTTQLNALNGLSLNKNTMLAKGSELYVPGN